MPEVRSETGAARSKARGERGRLVLGLFNVSAVPVCVERLRPKFGLPVMEPLRLEGSFEMNGSE